MTTGRINQVTAFSLRTRAQARFSRTPRGTGYGTCLARPNGTALVTARGWTSHCFARSITLPFAIPSRKHPPLLGRAVGLYQGEHTHTLQQLPRPAALWAVELTQVVLVQVAFNSSPNGIGRSLVQHPLRLCLAPVPWVHGS